MFSKLSFQKYQNHGTKIKVSKAKQVKRRRILKISLKRTNKPEFRKKNSFDFLKT
jgi:hypothetical protein